VKNFNYYLSSLCFVDESSDEDSEVFSSFKRSNNFSTAGSSGFVFRRYFAKKRDLTACFSTFFFQAFLRIFFFDLLVRFC
jgi:hypothetical protein